MTLEVILGEILEAMVEDLEADLTGMVGEALRSWGRLGGLRDERKKDCLGATGCQ